jgi:hypothetical protein
MLMNLIIVAAIGLIASAPAFAQEVTIAAQGGKAPSANEAAHCVAYYRTEAKLRRPPNAPFEETLRGQAWKSYLQTAAKGADPNALIAEAEKEVSAALAKSRNTWRNPYEEPCGSYEQVNLP